MKEVLRKIMTSLVWVLLTGLTVTAALAQGGSTGNLYDERNQHANPNAAITSENVGQLQQAWKIDTEEHVSHAPLVQNGRLYFADWGGNVYAADAVTGEIIWQTQAQEEVMEMWPWYGFAGTGALGEGMLFEASTEGTAYGIDAETGEVRWQTDIAEDEQAGNISKLLYHDGLVFIGLSSVEEALDGQIEDFTPDFQGRVVALEAATGEMQWELQLAEAPATGAGMWSSFALDPELDLLYFSTSNSYVTEASPYSDAVLAVRPRTGEIVWATQVTEGDLWTIAEPIGPDYAFGAGAQLFEAEVDGVTRELVGAGQKSGYFHAFDRATGEIVWQAFVGYGATGGGIHAEASIGDGVVYAWSNNNYTYQAAPEDAPITIKALDAATGKTLWFKDKAQPAAIPAASMLANDVYFAGSIDGTIGAYSISDGEQLWSTKYQDAIATPLNVVGNTLFFGTGIPERFGGQPGNAGMVAYSVGGQVDLAQQAQQSMMPEAAAQNLRTTLEQGVAEVPTPEVVENFSALRESLAGDSTLEVVAIAIEPVEAAFMADPFDQAALVEALQNLALAMRTAADPGDAGLMVELASLVDQTAAFIQNEGFTPRMEVETP